MNGNLQGTSQEHAERFLALYTRRTQHAPKPPTDDYTWRRSKPPPIFNHPQPPPPKTQRLHKHGVLPEIIIEQTPSREWITSIELYRRVVDDYGSICMRHFYRHLKWLRDSGRLLVMVDETRGMGYSQHRYRKPVSPTK